MHIVMVTPFPDDKPKGGVEAAALNLVRQIASKGTHRITVIVPSYYGANHAEERDGYTLQWVEQPRMGFISYWTVLRSRVHEHLKLLQPDIVHFQALLALSYGYKGPYIGTVHGIGEQDIRTRGGRFSEVRARILGFAEGRARRTLTDCIVINPYVADMLGGQIDAAKQHHICNPLHATFFEPTSAVERNNDFLFIAKMDRNKNLYALIEAFTLAEENLPADARVVVYGAVADEVYHTECLAALSGRGLSDRFVFAGLQPADKIAEHMRSARALVLTSKHEVAPMVISEALSCGLPTITYRKCGMQYMLKHGETGYLLEDKDLLGVSRALVSVIHAEGLEDNCRQAGLAYSPEHVAEATLKSYQQVIDAANA